MKSALQVELQDLHGLPYFATIIWFVLLGVSLLAIVFYLLNKNQLSKNQKNNDLPSEKRSQPKGF
ncbi:hypothetical protein [Prochlorococcus marinus]|uniref:hypothetical protein n=1 Tax=Prochlorococcus marinus TaxID=1219 RepID=UPI001C596FEC|nr:hypothetical protein [Prochlorococcus marinus]MBW3042329.1 hypothetical protein [Prochlorococcus marinus str. XMU1408]